MCPRATWSAKHVCELQKAHAWAVIHATSVRSTEINKLVVLLQAIAAGCRERAGGNPNDVGQSCDQQLPSC